MSTVKELNQYREYAERDIQDVIYRHVAKMKELGAFDVIVTVDHYPTQEISGRRASTLNLSRVEVTV